MAQIFDPKPIAVPGFEFEERIIKAAAEAESLCRESFEEIDETAAFNSEKVLRAFINNKVSAACLSGTTGYGYGDIGRDTLDKVFAETFRAEDALVRSTIASGTAALTTALFGVLRPGDKIVSLTGDPYDTLEEVIGIRGSGSGSLADFGIAYDKVEMTPDGNPKVGEIFQKVKGAKVAYIQRSRGYSLRPSLTVGQVAEIIKAAKGAEPDCIVMVDNCYGEFAEKAEPTQVGADLAIGSLIKNPGGGIAHSGGYIAGKAELVELCAGRMTAPGVGREAGATFDENRSLYQGLFLAPEVTANALKTAVFTTRIMDLFGYEVYPSPSEKRGDIITSVVLGSEGALIAFCKGLQKGSPIDSFVSPEPWDMPGYDSQVIMAAGTFNNGASIELSADGPLRDPYAVYIQGGLTYTSGKLGVMCALQEMYDKGELKLFR
ncbi:MAG: methionine gamma-lyase family protein [Oscillospiraceae bacterium]|nr:methionine gamma-lyase family protein [Oscillospiraceae bacterium]